MIAKCVQKMKSLSQLRQEILSLKTHCGACARGARSARVRVYVRKKRVIEGASAP